jgi:hypothetical protein
MAECNRRVHSVCVTGERHFAAVAAACPGTVDLIGLLRPPWLSPNATDEMIHVVPGPMSPREWLRGE